MRTWEKYTATCLTVVALLSYAGLAQSERIAPTSQKQRIKVEQPPDEQQDRNLQQEDRQPVTNIVANRPEAQTIWEFISQYSASDKIRRLLNSHSRGIVTSRCAPPTQR